MRKLALVNLKGGTDISITWTVKMILALLLVVAWGGCGLRATPSPTPDTETTVAARWGEDMAKQTLVAEAVQQTVAAQATPVPLTSPPPAPTETPPLTATPQGGVRMAEEYNVYSACIEAFFLVEGVELIVIRDHTDTDGSVGNTLAQEMRYVQDSLGSAVSEETLRDYRVQNASREPLSRRLALDVEVAFLSDTEFEAIFAAPDGWEQFYALYPHSQGIMTLSRVGFDRGMEQALVYVGNQVHYLAGQGYYLFLSKEGGRWVIQETVLVWIS